MFPLLASSGGASESLAISFTRHLTGRVRNPREGKNPIETTPCSRVGKDRLVLVLGVAAAIKHRSLLDIPDKGLRLALLLVKVELREANGPFNPLDLKVDPRQLVVSNSKTDRP